MLLDHGLKYLVFILQEDEEAFEMFSTYCGLALHHAKLYEKIRRSEQKYRVSLEVLSYHNASSVNEVEELVQEGLPPKDDDLQKYVCPEFGILCWNRSLYVCSNCDEIFSAPYGINSNTQTSGSQQRISNLHAKHSYNLL